METRIIPFVAGDGVGPEVTRSMRRILDAAVLAAYDGQKRIEWKEIFAGEMAWERYGTRLPAATVAAFREFGVGIKGPLDTASLGEGIGSLNMALRQQLDLYVCLRSLRWFRGLNSPVNHPEKVDMVVFRENTEDVYAGIEWEAGSPQAEKFGAFLRDEMGVRKVRFPATTAYGVKPVSREGTERLVRAACRYALSHGRPSVTLVHKEDFMRLTEGGFKKWGYEIAEREFRDEIADGRLKIQDCLSDTFLQNALLCPEDYSVIATLNLNGDYISDMLAAEVGGVGITPGANINYDSGLALFEATHGIEPEMAGRDVANPCSTVLSGAMMLEYIGWGEAAGLIYAALEMSFTEGIATEDLARMMPRGRSVGTAAFTDHIISLISS